MRTNGFIALAAIVMIILSASSTQGQTISIIGPATPSGDWSTDMNMVQNDVDPNLWELEIALTDSVFKFRQDASWTVNWGGLTFPSGTGVPDGPNIEATAGYYYVTFNTASLAYNFAEISDGHVGIGTHLPSEKLDVNGNIKFSGELKPGGVSGNNGQVLQSNGDGTMGWTDASASSGGSVGYGTWGGCDMANFSEYLPITQDDPNLGAFGTSVSIDGNYAIVGAQADGGPAGTNQGSASIYSRNLTNGAWELDYKILDPDGSASDYFGISVSISGDYAIGGAYSDDGPAGSDQGSASIFKRNGTSSEWELQGSKLYNPGATEFEYFGYSVSISGDYAIVGAPYDNGAAGFAQGSASIFKRNPSTGEWELQGSKLLNSSPATGDNFGWSVSISGDYAMVGAPYDDGPAGSDQGSASIYKRNELTDIWELQGSVLRNLSPASGEHFGHSVSISGDHAIVGAPNDSDNGISSGSALVFKRDPDTDTWTNLFYKLFITEAVSNEEFGSSVFIEGNNAMVGAPSVDAVTLFVNTGYAWQQIQKITDPAGVSGDSFGFSCCLDGSTKRFIIGAANAFAGYGKVVFGKFE
jgi:hypothetical protein